MRGFEPPISGPPDQHFNRTKLHPEFYLQKIIILFSKILHLQNYYSFQFITYMKRTFVGLFFLLIYSSLFAQNTYTISGYVQEEATGETLIGVNIFDQATLTGTISNEYGFYSITLEEGDYNIIYSFIGLETNIQKVNLSKNIRLNVSLNTKTILTNEVVITSEKEDKNIQSSSMSQTKLQVKNIKQIPVILGEIDVIKSAQLLPGIQSGGEGNSALYVRGGGPDQNLILLDEAIVYNASHLFGFFSVFNADAIKDINVIKGGMPAEYGGRLSSVLDISMKDGNNKKYEADGGIGLLSSRLTLQGPIQKNKSSFIVSGRRTYECFI